MPGLGGVARTLMPKTASGTWHRLLGVPWHCFILICTRDIQVLMIAH